ncbi:hypothetical protein DB345_12335 [Spartobacteria bacterium LR76]|nr:hypothetical protein DB345_12335 [Spartobacteria bacterium LR76]
MPFLDDAGIPILAVPPAVYEEEESEGSNAGPDKWDALAVYSRLLGMCSTPGQIAAAQYVCGMDNRRPCEIALSLRVSRQRFNALRHWAEKRLSIIKGGVYEGTA